MILLTAFGETKDIASWEKDPRCKVGRQNLYNRVVKCRWEHERAITTQPNPRGGLQPRRHQAFGEYKTLWGWANDPRCAVTETALRRRLAAGFTLEEAMQAKVVRRYRGR